MFPALHADRARIYVSFADDDRSRAMQLVRWLNDSGWSVSADDRHAYAAGDQETSGKLDACDVVLCVVTLAWLVSDSCRFELSYCARQGKFVLPVICDPWVMDVLPAALQALPRVDLTQNRLIDYLTLKYTLRQAGSKIGRAAEVEGRVPRRLKIAWQLRAHRRSIALAAALLVSMAAIWLWLHS
jgi:hypothetical protein